MNGNGTQVAPSAGAMVKQEIGSVTTSVSAETSALAVAAAQEAMVKARVALARHNPRDMAKVRQRILADCDRPGFADAAMYSKPVGKKQNDATGKWEEQFVEGMSVRFAEALLRHMGNMFVDAMIVLDDAEKRQIKVMAMDLETNATDAQDVMVRKTVERKAHSIRGREVLSTRENSYGEKVSRVIATEDEVLNMTNSAVSKMRRNKILELAPADIVEEAEEKCRQTLEAVDNADPEGLRKKIISSFAKLKISEKDIEQWLGKGLTAISVPELQELRKIRQAIADGETSWKSVLESRGGSDTPTAAPTTPTPPPTTSATTATTPPAATTAPTQPTTTTPPPAPSSVPPGGVTPELLKRLEEVFASAKKKGDLGAAVKMIGGLPTPEMQAEWRARYNARQAELPLA